MLQWHSHSTLISQYSSYNQTLQIPVVSNSYKFKTVTIIPEMVTNNNWNVLTQRNGFLHWNPSNHILLKSVSNHHINTIRKYIHIPSTQTKHLNIDLYQFLQTNSIMNRTSSSINQTFNDSVFKEVNHYQFVWERN